MIKGTKGILIARRRKKEVSKLPDLLIMLR